MDRILWILDRISVFPLVFDRFWIVFQFFGSYSDKIGSYFQLYGNTSRDFQGK
ncbi:hypothetical protein [Virgibacillus oceani]|uniref:hypothetical protein n=1 Tax=Virgibacillus oceani TaxID=1479511 RepID=UPI001664C62E|nr:hypothetical protein [Virgibacillus oceani]